MRAALAVLLAATSLCMLAAARKSPSQWGSMKDRDWDEVEKELEEGDEDELLVTEDALLAREYERRSETSTIDVTALGKGDQAIETAAHHQAMQGPTMVFAELTKTVPPSISEGVPALRRRRLAEGTLEADDALSKPGAGQGPEWDDAAMDVLSTAWKEHLFAASITASVYRIDAGSLMVALQRGWHGPEARDFLVGREEVVNVKWDDRDYPGKGAKAEAAEA